MTEIAGRFCQEQDTDVVAQAAAGNRAVTELPLRASRPKLTDEVHKAQRPGAALQFARLGMRQCVADVLNDTPCLFLLDRRSAVGSGPPVSQSPDHGAVPAAEHRNGKALQHG